MKVIFKANLMAELLNGQLKILIFFLKRGVQF